MEDLTPEETEILGELDRKHVIEIVGRKHPDYNEEVSRRSRLLKGLVYKDLINFSIEKDFYGYKFFSRNLTDGKRF